MWYILVVILVASSCDDSFASSVQSSRQKRDDESEPWKKPYLPNTIEPTLYDMFIAPYYYNNGSTFHGNVSIDINVRNQTKTIIIHKKQLTLLDWRVYDLNATEISVESYLDWPENDYYVMKTTDFLPDKARLFFVFSGNMSLITGSSNRIRRSGLYNIPYVNEAGYTSWLVLTDFRPSDARKVFPCFDEPRFKAQFKITVRHWNTYTGLSNMPMERIEIPDHAAHDTVFKLSPKMSSYQVAFAVTDFSSKNKTVDGKQHRVWAHPSRLEKVNYALDVTPTILNYLQQELDMPYSLEKLDQLAVPRGLFTDERENWGLVTYWESTLLFDATNGGDSARYEALKVIAHALAHNYFGNLVTCRYWEHVWLNEGLATFYEIRALTEVGPTFFHKEFVFGKKVEYSMLWDAKNVDYVALILPSDSSKVVRPHFDDTRRDKGAAILRMVENFVGADVFKRGIRQYLMQNANGTVVTDNLWAALQQKIDSDLDIKTVMMNWVEKAGFPVIKVELLPGNKINATQKRFLDDPRNLGNETYKWYVPLTYRTKGGIGNLVWMNETDVVFEIPELSSDDWIDFNYDRTGYYRVNYGDNLWDRLAMQMNEDHTVFTNLSRSKLFSDAVALAKAKEKGFDVFLNLTRYASTEKDLTSWFNIYEGFNELNRVFRRSGFPCYQNYLLNLTSPLMDELQVKDEGSYIEKQLRSMIISLACFAGHQGCIENTTRAFRAWIEDETTNAVPNEYKRDVYCTGMANSVGESEWNTTLERYVRATWATERSELLKALSCTRNVTLLERLLDYCLNTTFVSNGRLVIVMFHVANNPSRKVAFEWLKSRSSEIDRLKGCGFAGTLLPLAVQNFDTQELNQEVLDFYDAYPDIPEQSKEEANFYINANIQWNDRNFNTIENWLDNCV